MTTPIVIDYPAPDAEVQMSGYYVRIKGDVLIGVPPKLSQLTTWVLLEQEDWFEKEINFVRRLLKPGAAIVDIGANFGVYALTMAKLVAPNGHVWAFEPAREPQALLAQSMLHNGLTNLSLAPIALAAREGRAILHLNFQSELNSLVHTHGDSGVGAEEVPVSTLDHQQAAFGWPPIDFVKIDAEGAEQEILAGGERFFVEHSPLVMFEADHSHSSGDKHILPAAFRKLGYEIYRLIGPDRFLVLVTFDERPRLDEINLFACKPDRAAQLEREGFLTREPTTEIPAVADGMALFYRQGFASSFASVPPETDAYRAALDAYALWRDPGQTLGRRYAALLAALDHAKTAADAMPNPARLSTLARIASDASDRALALDSLTRLQARIAAGDDLPREAFFPASSRYESIDPAGGLRAWFLAATFEAFEVLRFLSGCFRPVAMQDLAMLDWLQSTPFASAAMERRRQLQRILAGVQTGLMPSPILANAAPDNLNPDLWMRR